MAPLAREVGFPPSTVHRPLTSLARDEFAEVDERTKRWSLGLRMFQLGQRVSHARGFSGVALPILQRVTATSQEATLMAVQDGDHQLFVHYVEGPQQLSVIGEPGKLGPLHCTGAGRIRARRGARTTALTARADADDAGHDHRPRRLPRGDRARARPGLGERYVPPLRAAPRELAALLPAQS